MAATTATPSPWPRFVPLKRPRATGRFSFQGTPDTRLTMISPGEGSISYHHGGGYGGGAYSGVGFHSYNAYAPHGSITGDRTVSHFDRDPSVDTPVVLTR